MPRGVVLLLHAGYWAMYLLLMALIFALVQAQTRSPMGLVTLLFRSRLAFQLIVPNVVAFYIAYGILAPRFLATRRFGAFILGGLVALLSASAVSLAGVPSRILDPSSIYIAANRITPFLMATGGIAAIHVTIATIMRGFVGWYDDFAERDALRRRTTEMEVALMRATLDPHFLFNTLNNIDTLITRAPETASLYLTRLSELLRFVLYDSRADLVPLDTELAFLDKYIALQRLRLRNPDTVTYAVRGNRQGSLIAPMLLVPFVENAFKHASGQKATGAIAVDIAVDNTSLRFTCANRYDPARRDQAVTDGTALAGGLGNDLIRRRLELLYAGRFTLQIDDQDAVYSVHLSVQLASAPISPSLHAPAATVTNLASLSAAAHALSHH
ncbi:two-component histidine kinase [Gemmatimonas aurantiaca T-27]|uniref:Two-component histidine kinase n=2 Tax=Gemmatimonas aurantiaca TaxID=173480 RepID=C1ACR9_GEMAT|nr:two-component histidine kinase [Gemmatimonas aurantiaca T-27]